MVVYLVGDSIGQIRKLARLAVGGLIDIYVGGVGGIE